MNTNTGQIKDWEEVQAMDAAQRAAWKEMKLQPSRRQRRDMMVGRNDSCPCGSGKKFKKCCYTGGCR